MVAEDRSIESTWALMGLASKLAQSVSYFMAHSERHGGLANIDLLNEDWTTYVLASLGSVTVSILS